ncbi:unnamed protein product [Tenebrio molitor]|nr:unnamed protein product [Tenebrio molitor]
MKVKTTVQSYGLWSQLSFSTDTASTKKIHIDDGVTDVKAKSQNRQT